MKDNPYAGPRPIGGTQYPGEKLYGRDREVGDLLDLVITDRIVLLYSPSGAGKTSLLQAGLVPALTRRRFKVRPITRVHRGPPPEAKFDWATGNRYTLSILLSLEEALPEAERTHPAALARLTLADYLDAHPTGDVLIIDQFEEILAVDPTDEATSLEEKWEFFTQLGDALRPKNRWAVLSLREYYLALCDPYLNLVPTRLSNTFRLDLLKTDAALEAIRGPAHERNVDFTEEAVNDLMNNLREVKVLEEDSRGGLEKPKTYGIYVEPVQMQVVCRRLWDGLPEGTTSIGSPAVASIGDVDTALGLYYEGALTRAAKENGVTERGLRDWFNDELITAHSTRSQTSLVDKRTEAIKPALKPLLDAYLIRPDRRLGTVWYELAHDRLVTPILASNRKWNADHLEKAQKLAVLWGNHRSGKLLVTGDDLQSAQTWAAAHDASLLPLEREYLQASALKQMEIDLSEKSARRLHLRERVAWTLAGVAFLFLAVAGVAGMLALRSERTAKENLAESGVRNVARLWGNGRPAEAMAHLARSLRLKPEDPAAYNWAAILLSWRQNRLPGSEFILQPRPDLVAFSGDGKRMVTVFPHLGLTKAQMWDLAGGTPMGRPFAITPTALATLNQDGSLLFTAPMGVITSASKASLYQTDGRLVQALSIGSSGMPGGIGMVESAEFSSSGAWLLVSTRENQAGAYSRVAYQLLDLQGKTILPEASGRAAFSPDGSHLLVTEGRAVSVWDLSSKKKYTSPKFPGTVLAAALSTDNRDVALLTSDSAYLHSWPIAGRQEIETPMQTPKSLPGQTQRMVFTAQGGIVVISPEYVTLFQQNKLLASYRLQAGERTLYTAGGKLLTVVRVQTITLLDADTLKVTGHLSPRGQIAAMAISPNQSRLTIATAATVTEGWAQSFDLRPNPLSSAVRPGDPAPPRRAIVPAASSNLHRSQDGQFELRFPSNLNDQPQVRDLRDKQDKWIKLNVHSSQLSPEGHRVGAFSADNQLVAFGDSNGEVLVFETATGEATGPLIRCPSPVTQMALSSDGHMLFTASSDHRVRVWDVYSSVLIAALEHDRPVTAVMVSADGLRLTTATEHQQFGWDLGFSPKLALPLANLAEAAGGYRLPINSKRINLQPILLPERQERLDRVIAEPRLTPVAKRFQH